MCINKYIYLIITSYVSRGDGIRYSICKIPLSFTNRFKKFDLFHTLFVFKVIQWHSAEVCKRSGKKE